MTGPADGPRHRLGLRARVTAAFALGALALSVALAASTYAATRKDLVDQRERTALRQAYVDARLVRAGLRSAEVDVPRLLGSLDSPTGSQPLIRYHNDWFSSSLRTGREVLPADLRRSVAEGSAARMFTSVHGQPVLAIGVPIPTADAAYFEVSSMVELGRTLDVLAVTLSLAAVLTALAGAALGWWASRRLLQPVREVSVVASEIASGHLDTRLHPLDPDLVELATSFNAMVEALQRRIERDARFASDVSHELRSPLTTLMTSLSVLESRRADLPDRSRRALDLMADEVRRFEALVQDLLEMSRVDAGAVSPDLEEVRFGEYLLRVAERLPDASFPIELDAAAGDALVMVDKRRLERVLANLVQNARSHGGGVVRLGLLHTGAAVRIEVDDAGPGVPPEDRARIFERFNRGHAAGRRSSSGGTGLGLALVSEHVRLHGGTIWVEDRPGGGARFVVELPALAPARQPLAEGAAR